MLTISFKDFGPLAEGSLELRPLTILVGPNNTGKSYVARLVYASMGPLGRTRRRLNMRRLWSTFGDSHLTIAQRYSDETKQWAANQMKEGSRLKLDELPRDLLNGINRAAKLFVDDLVLGLANEIQRCFGSRLANLARAKASSGWQFTLDQKDPRLILALAARGRSLQVLTEEITSPNIEIDLRNSRRVPTQMFLESLQSQVLREIFRDFAVPTYYFPAARSGILQGHKLLASVWLTRLPLIGIEPVEIPQLSGEVADFISNMLRLERGKGSTAVRAIGKFLEAEACRGKLDLRTRSKSEFPEVLYSASGGRFPLHRTSSMISELAPIIVFLKHVVEPGNLLILEEPEAHLHPVNQRIMATVVVRLIRQGVRVLLTTHSDYFLHQISNFIRMGTLGEQRTELGYQANDYLSANEVSALLFTLPKDSPWSCVRPLQVSDSEGIPEDEHLKIAEAIYDETVHLQRLLSVK